MEQSEEHLISQAKRDSKNFEPLYNKYFKRIFLFVLNKTGDKNLTADITSQVFLKALTGLKNYTYRGVPLSAWLYKIAINECNEHFRKSAAKQFVILDEVNCSVIGEEMQLFDDDIQLLIKNAVAKLKSADIQVIELRFFESLSFKELGIALGITENNAKVRLYRAVDKLRKLIKKA